MASRATGRWVRWCAVALGVAVLISLPTLVTLRSATGTDLPAATVLRRIQQSSGVAYSGYAESSGYLDLPTVSQFGSVSDLLSSRTDQRVWYRSGTDWRVDTVTPVGETDLHGTATGIWAWDYESSSAVFTADADPQPARLLRSDDLLPAELARRLLSQVTPSEVRVIASRIVAGQSAIGLRMTPSEAQSTVAHVDVWALPGSGLPLRVDVYAKGSTAAVLTTAMLSVSTARPSAATTAFTPPATSRTRTQNPTDIVSLIERFGRVRPPAQLAGLARNAETIGSIGVYGHGVTTMLALPVPPRLGRQVRTQLGSTVGQDTVDAGKDISIGLTGVNLLLTATAPDGWSWLLVGTVTAQTLTDAGAQLPPAGGDRG